ncbi:MAG: type I methionyl aminopeptidase [Christensenellales bacterium]
MIILKSNDEIDLMRKAGRLTAQALEYIGKAVRPGITTKELDAMAEQFIRERGGSPSFKNYRGFPATICASVNEQVVHGLPSGRKLKEGDIIGIDMGVCLHGYHGDTANTFPVGGVEKEAMRLIEVTKQCFYEGFSKAVVGNRIGDIAEAVQRKAESAGFSVVREMVGHGVGRELHESPDVPNFGTAGHGFRLRDKMTIAIEPMINMGDATIEFLPDGCVVAADGKYSAHYEHTIAILENGPEILTKMD